jgi:predicted dehydrogenase
MAVSAVRKGWRYIGLYGFGRTLFKIAGRSRRTPPLVLRRHDPQDIALIGCGQFGVATLGYFLTRRFGKRLRWVYDIDDDAARSGARLLAAAGIAASPQQILDDPAVRYVYIASNHATHADYAVAALDAGKTVFVEKPVSVTAEQFVRLSAAAGRAPGRLFAGYNRPFAAAIRALRDEIGPAPLGGLSLNCFVSGHVIGPEHWYRDPAEGTRICGNAGHWIDLFVHALAWRGLPDRFRIQLLQADVDEPDDNFALSIATGRGDIFTLMLTARNEPFEGINETINVQQDDVICKIDDFRRMVVWKGPALRRRRFWPKDAGHRAAALQPFAQGAPRDWAEVETSTLLILRITEMVRTGQTQTEFSRAAALAAVEDAKGAA